MWLRLCVIGLLGLLIGCNGAGDGPSAETLRARVDSLEQELEDALAQVQTLENAREGTTLEVLPVDVYFQRGSAELTPEGADRLDSLVSVIREQYGDRPIRVEGYADDLPVRDTTELPYVDNWELSAARAASVVRFFQWGHDIAPSRFEVVGYGSHRPLVPNTSAENRARNRRVRIAVLPEQFGYQPPDTLTGSEQ